MLTRGKRRKINERPFWRKLANEDKYEEAFKELVDLARRGDAEAQYWMGQIYYDGGLGQKTNSALAMTWFGEAKKQKHPLATYMYVKITTGLGDKKWMLENDVWNRDPFVLSTYYDDVRENDKALAFLKLCDDTEHPYVQYMKGAYLKCGWGRERMKIFRDVKTGLELLEKSANSGFIYAQRHLHANTHGIDSWKWHRKLQASYTNDVRIPDCGCYTCNKLPYTLSRYNAMNAFIVFVLIHKHANYSLLHKDVVFLISRYVWRTSNQKCWEF